MAKRQKFAIFGQNLENENFFKNLLFLAYKDTTLCKKSEQSYERISRSLPNERTDVRTDGRTNERDLIGPNRSAGDQKW